MCVKVAKNSNRVYLQSLCEQAHPWFTISHLMFGRMKKMDHFLFYHLLKLIIHHSVSAPQGLEAFIDVCLTTQEIDLQRTLLSLLTSNKTWTFGTCVTKLQVGVFRMIWQDSSMLTLRWKNFFQLRINRTLISLSSDYNFFNQLSVTLMVFVWVRLLLAVVLAWKGGLSRGEICDETHNQVWHVWLFQSMSSWLGVFCSTGCRNVRRDSGVAQHLQTTNSVGCCKQALFVCPHY